MMTRYFTFFEAAKNSNKFWEITLDGCTVTTKWGRVGVTSQEKTKTFGSVYAAECEVDKKVREKRAKGYTEKDITDQVDTVIDDTQTTLTASVVSFVKKVYDYTKKKVQKYSGGTVNDLTGKLSQKAIDNARAILQNVADGINANDTYKIKDYSQKYFKAIPRKMPHKITESDWVLNTTDKVNKEMEVLDLYEDALKALSTKRTTIDEMYDGLKSEIIDVTDDEMGYIKNKIATSHASNHHYTLKVLNAYKVNQKNAPAYDTSRGHDTMLFHGTRNENLLGILSTNLKLPNTLNGVVKTGAMFGPGLYFANNCTKSANYSFGYWSGSAVNTAYLFICKVALGNVKEYENAHYCTKAPSGYDSVMGKKGRYLYNNEFIVYNENQVEIEYIVEVTKN